MRSSYDPGNVHLPNPYESRAPPPGRLDLPSHRPYSHRATTEPAAHNPHHPRTSPPAMAQPLTTHSSDLFFTRTPAYVSQHMQRARSYTPLHQYQPVQPHPPRANSQELQQHHNSPPVPHFYSAPVRSTPPPPPPPPKPTSPYQSPYFSSLPPLQSSPKPSPSILPSAPLVTVSENTPDSPTDQDELRQVIVQSEEESSRRRQYLNELSLQEEDELARALEASKLQTSSRRASRNTLTLDDYAGVVGPSSAIAGPSRPTITTTEVSPLEKGRTFARELVAQYDPANNPNSSFLDIVQRSNEPSPLAEVPRTHSSPSAEPLTKPPSTSPTYSAHGIPSSSTTLEQGGPVTAEVAVPTMTFPEPDVPSPTAENQIMSDAAFARQLAAQLEQEEIEEEERLRKEEEQHAQALAGPLVSAAPPSYNFATTSAASPPPPPPPPPASQNEALQATLSRNNSQDSGSSQASSSANDRLAPIRPTVYRSSSSEETPGASVDGSSPVESNYSMEPSPITPVNKSPFGSPELKQETNNTANNNQFLDAELLMGVSIGFSTPMINLGMAPMQGAMPNIISLPYGRCPPLHLQASSWRHLLRLLARLSGTRIEPTVEAMSLVKTQMKLRTVVQFIKPHASARDWRTVLWFTLDHPVPSAMPSSHKYSNGDVSTLPWSYTLSTVPTLLRDGADSPVSKWYTVPSTEATPYPALPIAFPNLALYLQAALDESRRAAGDSSGGTRKLAKMVEQCYPHDVRLSAPEEAADRRSVGGRLLARFGKGAKAKKQGRGGNEETYELVTPFMPDEWG